MVFVANIGGMLAPIITGYLVKGTGTFLSAFLASAPSSLPRCWSSSVP